MAAYGLYTHIRSNRRRSIALLIGLFFLVYVMVFAGALLAEAWLSGNLPFDVIVQRAWADFLTSWPFATVGAILWMLIAYRFNQSMIDALTGGHEVTRRDEPRLYNLLENLCISRGIPMPKLKIMDSGALNAFASGLNQKQYSVTVTSGLINRLNDAELEAVLAHELTHIRNGDVRMMVVAVIIAGCISFFAEILFRTMFYGRWGRSSGDGDRKGGAGLAIVLAIVLVAVAWFLSLLIRFALSRSREFLADAGAVELTKNPDAMIMALRKIEGRGELEGVTSSVMEMCVDNPRSGFADLFASHPSIDRRVDALVKMAGGHDPGPIALTDQSAETQSDAADGLESGPWGDAKTDDQTSQPSPDSPKQNQPINPLPFPGSGPWGPSR
ncbi:MAG: M48 family metallopeptidase [Pseudorhodoplanes sp.]